MKKFFKWFFITIIGMISLLIVMAIIVELTMSDEERAKMEHEKTVRDSIRSVRAEEKRIENKKRMIHDSLMVADPQYKWDHMNNEKKKEWIKKQMESEAALNLNTDIQDNIAKRFNYPMTVEYKLGNRPCFVNAVIANPESGFVVINGTGSAKNAFGVPSAFTYHVGMYITPMTGFEITQLEIFTD